jgi:hypothetical protein
MQFKTVHLPFLVVLLTLLASLAYNYHLRQFKHKHNYVKALYDMTKIEIQHQNNRLYATLAQKDSIANTIHLQALATSLNPNSNDNANTKVHYEIQLAAFAATKDEPLPHYINKATHDEQKFTFGHFKTYKEASMVAKSLQKMDTKGAFIVALVNNKKVAIQQAINLEKNN